MDEGKTECMDGGKKDCTDEGKKICMDEKKKKKKKNQEYLFVLCKREKFEIR